MATLIDFQEALGRFQKLFPRPGVPDLLSRLKFVEFSYKQDWSRLWSDGGVLQTHADDPCVYFFFDSAKQLIYIGETRILGKRFYQHFDQKNAKWSDRTNNLAILPLPKENWFETAAIERYLIQQLQPQGNIVGKA